MTEDDQAERDEPRRPRVVDKRVSARTEDRPAPEERVPRDRGPAPEPSAAPAGAPETPEHRDSAAESVWTPEQEAEAQRMLEVMRTTPSRDWVLNSCVTLANVAGVKLDAGDLQEAQFAIDAFAALLDGLGTRLGEAETPLKRTLSQLQLAYAETASGSSGSPPG